MKIRLLSLRLLNFKGVRDMTIKFGQETNISGKNESGKTTIFDAFLWLLFDKDSTDRTSFEIKPLDINNKHTHKVETEVTADMDINGERVVLKKTYKEKWEKQKGSAIETFKGHTNSFLWNDVPVQLGEYQEKLNAILKENIFKLITNTGYFNALTWEKRRSALIQIAGEITNENVFDSLKAAGIWNKDNRPSWSVLVNELNTGKPEDGYRKQILARKKIIKDELDLIPFRIDEAKRSINDEEEDYDALELRRTALKEELIRIDETLLSKSQAHKEKETAVLTKMREIQGLKTKKQNLEFTISNQMKDARMLRDQKLADLKRNHQSAVRSAQDVSASILVYQGKVTEIETKLKDLRLRFDTEDKKKLPDLDPSEMKCPTCKQDLQAESIDLKKTELKNNFNSNKAKILSDLNKTGVLLTQELKDAMEKIAELQRDLDLKTMVNSSLSGEMLDMEKSNAELLTSESLDLVRKVANDPEIKTLGIKIDALEAETKTPKDPEENNQELKIRKQVINDEIEVITTTLGKKEIRQRTKDRIVELEKQEKDMASELSLQEGIEFSIEQFIKAKMETLESRVNDRFRIVKFKLFREQVNGGEEPCCDTLIKGVPYKDANRASQINAGLDIINTLSEHYDAYCPIFVDNAEAVNKLIDVNAQLIRLVVSNTSLLISSSVETKQEELFEVAQ